MMVPKVPMNANLLTKPDGSVCKDSSDNVKFLLQSHFTNGKILNEYPLEESEDTIWNEGTYLQDKAIDPLLKIQSASIQLQYIPLEWRKSRVVFIQTRTE
jgi:hypothetical protein